METTREKIYTTKIYTTTGGYVELRAPVDGETYEGRAVYADAQRAAQAMADKTQADVEVYDAEGYLMSVATPATMDTDLDDQTYRPRVFQYTDPGIHELTLSEEVKWLRGEAK